LLEWLLSNYSDTTSDQQFITELLISKLYLS